MAGPPLTFNGSGYENVIQSMAETIIKLRNVATNQDELLANQAMIIDNLTKRVDKQERMIHRLQDKCDSLEQGRP